MGWNLFKGLEDIFTGGAEQKVPDRGYGSVDGNTEQLIKNKQDLANQNSVDIGDKYSAQLPAAQGLLGSGQDKSDALGMMSNQANTQAIQNRAGIGLNSYVNKIQKQNQYDAIQKNAEQKQQAFQAANSEYQFNKQVSEDRWSNNMDNFMQRQQLIKNIFGGAGTALGTYAGSRYGGRSGKSAGYSGSGSEDNPGDNSSVSEASGNDWAAGGGSDAYSNAGQGED